MLRDKKFQQFGLDASFYPTRLSQDDLGTVTVGPEWKLQNPAIKFDIRTLGERRTKGGLSESLIQVVMVCVEPLFAKAFSDIVTRIDPIVRTPKTKTIRQAELDRLGGKEAADSTQFYVDASFSEFIRELNRIAATLQDERIREGSSLYTLTMPVRKIMWGAKKLDLTLIGDLTSFGDFTFIGKYTYYDQERRERVDLGHDIYFMSFIVHPVMQRRVKVRAQCYVPALRKTLNRILTEISKAFKVSGLAPAGETAADKPDLDPKSLAGRRARRDARIYELSLENKTQQVIADKIAVEFQDVVVGVERVKQIISAERVKRKKV